MKRKPAGRVRWTCPNCHQPVASPFCPTCGETQLNPNDLTLRGLTAQVVQACSSIDEPLLRSLRCLLLQPGLLTLAWLQGQRKLYTPPLQLFLVANVLFFAMQSVAGAKIFSTPLDQHLHSDIWGGLAQQLLSYRLASKHLTLNAYTPIFNQAVALNAKSLIVLMVPPFALIPALLFHRRGLPFVTHLVFSCHFYAFLLLLLSVSLTVLGISLLFGGPGLESETFDHALSIVELLVSATYLHRATGAAYGAKGVPKFFKVLPLTLAVGVIFLGYRFVLFLITLYTT